MRCVSLCSLPPDVPAKMLGALAGYTAAARRRAAKSSFEHDYSQADRLLPAPPGGSARLVRVQRAGVMSSHCLLVFSQNIRRDALSACNQYLTYMPQALAVNMEQYMQVRMARMCVCVCVCCLVPFPLTSLTTLAGRTCSVSRKTAALKFVSACASRWSHFWRCVAVPC